MVFKDGYFLASTAYLIAAVSFWIRLYERDVVFLKFGRFSLTQRFFDLIQEFKRQLSTDSILWFHYINGRGEELKDPGGERPISMSEFTKKLAQDRVFRGCYDQLFEFLNELPCGKLLQNVVNTNMVLCETMSFLEVNKVMIPMNRRDAAVAIAGELAGSRPH